MAFTSFIITSWRFKLASVSGKGRIAVYLIFIVFIGGVIGVLWQRGYLVPLPVPRPKLARPYGMAPAAFDGFVRACRAAQIHPWRIGQTIGDSPRSFGYHFRDGLVRWRGQSLDYTAAVDVGVQDLSRAQINRFLETLAAQGFVAFYREKGKWRGFEHIHAIYAPLKMKAQLRRQVREWEETRRKQGRKRYAWQTRWRANWRG